MGVDADIATALLERALTIPGGLPLAQPNINYAPVLGLPFNRLALFGIPPVNTFIDQGERLEGFMQVSCFRPVGEGIIQGKLAADQVVDHFPRGLSLTSGATTIRIQQRPAVAAAIAETDWLQIPVTISWVTFT